MHRSRRDAFRVCRAFDEVEDEKWPEPLFCASARIRIFQSIDVRDLGVVQGGEHPCFPLEPGESAGVVANFQGAAL